MVWHSFSARAVNFVTGRTTAAREKTSAPYQSYRRRNMHMVRKLICVECIRYKRRIKGLGFSFYHCCNVFSCLWV